MAFGHGGGELAQSLAHEPRLQAHVTVAHVALNFRSRHQGRHGVHHDDIEGTGAHENLGDLQSLLAGVRLTDQEIVHIHTEFACVNRIHGVLGVNESRRATGLLGLSQNAQRQCGLARAFWTIDLDDPSTRHATHAKGQIQSQGSGGNGRNIRHDGLVAQAHDRAFSELLFNGRDSEAKCLNASVVFLTGHSNLLGQGRPIHLPRCGPSSEANLALPRRARKFNSCGKNASKSGFCQERAGADWRGSRAFLPGSVNLGGGHASWRQPARYLSRTSLRFR